jgi:hypothetical protein
MFFLDNYSSEERGGLLVQREATIKNNERKKQLKENRWKLYFIYFLGMEVL